MVKARNKMLKLQVQHPISKVAREAICFKQFARRSGTLAQ